MCQSTAADLCRAESGHMLCSTTRVGMTVLVNTRAGSEPREGALEEALRGAGIRATVRTVSAGGDLRTQAERGATRGDSLVAAGGDGTVSTVAAVAARHHVPLGVLPLGTLNHFARDAGIPADTDGAIAALKAKDTRTIDLGEVNGWTFINNASLGIYPRLVWERDEERRRGRGKWVAVAVAAVRVWRRYRTLTVRLHIDQREYIRRTPFVFVGNGRYTAEGMDLGGRQALDGGVLSVYVAPYCGRFDLLRIAIRALAGRLEAEPKFESFEGREVTIDTVHKHVRIALDGEIVELTPPLVCRVRPRALRLLMPEPEPQNPKRTGNLRT